MTLTAQASGGYVFDRWSGEVDGIADVTQSTVVLVMTDDRSITANFAVSSVRYALSAASQPAAGGSVELSPSGPTYPINQVVSVSPAPNQGYVFSHWTGDLTGTADTASMRLTRNMSITAVFNPVLSASVSVADGGSVEATPALTADGYPIGTSVSLTARPALGYIFDGWTGDLAGIQDARAATVTVIMDSSRTLTANFVASPPLAINVAVQDGKGGSLTLQPAQPPQGYLASQQVSIYAVPETGYGFSHWSGDKSGTSPILTFTVDRQQTIVAVFDPKVAVQCDPVEAGTVEMTSPGSSGGYSSGTNVSLEAKPGKGYRFSHWIGDLSGSDNPATMGVDLPKAVTAVFVKESAFNWTWVVIAAAAIVAVLIGVIVLRLAWVLLRRTLEGE